MLGLEKVINSNTLTLGRSFLATSTLITLLFTEIEDLFPVHHLIELRKDVEGVMELNYFLWFENITIPYIFSIIVLLMVILGFYPRYFSILHAWISYSVFYTMLIVEGGDQIICILTLLIIPVCILDSRTNGWTVKGSKKPLKNAFLFYNAKYSMLFITIQMSVVYFNASVSKMFAPEWGNGTAVYYWFFDNMFGAPKWMQHIAGPLFTNDISVTLINWSVILLELFLFIGLFLKQHYKYLLFLLGITFHFLIFIVHGLFTFSIAMLGGLILYYLQLDKSIIENIKQIKTDMTFIIRQL
ncbi:MAG: hypothetical protein OXE77_12070 [Flavobacteriaceae bacterium]|nr:hypothetical protein [Flavobacteriaceae bacterium]MCY4267630.1 hypothetical protein [Flavobacteriaceae bacterium]